MDEPYGDILCGDILCIQPNLFHICHPG